MTFGKEKQKPPAGMLVTESQSGDAPKLPFPMKTNEKSQNQSQINHRNESLFLSLRICREEMCLVGGA